MSNKLIDGISSVARAMWYLVTGNEGVNLMNSFDTDVQKLVQSFIFQLNLIYFLYIVQTFYVFVITLYFIFVM